MAQPETNSKKKPENTKQTQPHQEREREREGQHYISSIHHTEKKRQGKE